MEFSQNPDYAGLRQLFHDALKENNLIDDGDFDWIKPLQEHRLNRNKTVTGMASTNAAAKKTVNTANGTSSSITRNNNELRNLTVAPRSIYHRHPLPLSSTNATTLTLNGGSKTTLSMVSTTRMPVTLPSSRATIENNRPIPAKRHSLAPPPPPSTSLSSSNHAQYSTNVNNCNREQYSSEPTCCFFKPKAKQALQITSTTNRKT